MSLAGQRSLTLEEAFADVMRLRRLEALERARGLTVPGARLGDGGVRC